MLGWIEIGFASAIVGMVHCVVLWENDTPLNFFYVFLNRFSQWPWLFKPLGDCVLCFSGQLALWTSVFTDPGDILSHVWSAALAIVTAHFLAYAWEKTKS